MKRKLTGVLLLVILAGCAGSSSFQRQNCSSGGEVCVNLRVKGPVRWDEPVTLVVTVISSANISDLVIHLGADSLDVEVLEASGEEPGKIIEGKRNWVNWQVDIKEKRPVVFTRKIILPLQEGFFRIRAQAYYPSAIADDMIRIYLTKKGGTVFLSGTPIPITPGSMPSGPTLSPEEIETLRAAPNETPYLNTPVITPLPEILSSPAYPPPGQTPAYP